jgi:hypothetical protein
MIECRGSVVCMEIDRSVRSQTDISSRDLAATKMPRNAALPRMPWIPGLAVAMALAACGGFDEPQGEDNDSSTAVPVAGGGRGWRRGRPGDSHPAV